MDVYFKHCATCALDPMLLSGKKKEKKEEVFMKHVRVCYANKRKSFRMNNCFTE